MTVTVTSSTCPGELRWSDVVVRCTAGTHTGDHSAPATLVWRDAVLTAVVSGTATQAATTP